MTPINGIPKRWKETKRVAHGLSLGKRTGNVGFMPKEAIRYPARQRHALREIDSFAI